MQLSLSRNLVSASLVSILLLIGFSACRPKKVAEAQAMAKAEQPASQQTAPAKINTAIGFRTRRNLEEH